MKKVNIGEFFHFAGDFVETGNNSFLSWLASRNFISSFMKCLHEN